MRVELEKSFAVHSNTCQVQLINTSAAGDIHLSASSQHVEYVSLFAALTDQSVTETNTFQLHVRTEAKNQNQLFFHVCIFDSDVMISCSVNSCIQPAAASPTERQVCTVTHIFTLRHIVFIQRVEDPYRL